MVEKSVANGTVLCGVSQLDETEEVEEILVVLTTAPDDETGAIIARALVAESLAACVNVIPGVRSFYQWQGQLQDDREVLLVAKIRADRSGTYETRMKELHPYDVPEIVAIPPRHVHRAYLDWCLANGAA